MIRFILTIVIGLGIAFFSRYNSAGITLTIGDYTYFNIPLFVLTVGTYLLGLFLAWIIEIPQAIMTSLHIMGLGHKISSGNNTILQLQDKIKRLGIENIKLQERNQSIIADKQTGGNYRPNIFQNLLHKLNLR